VSESSPAQLFFNRKRGKINNMVKSSKINFVSTFFFFFFHGPAKASSLFEDSAATSSASAGFIIIIIYIYFESFERVWKNTEKRTCGVIRAIDDAKNTHRNNKKKSVTD
jgi:hypothetical protein